MLRRKDKVTKSYTYKRSSFLTKLTFNYSETCGSDVVVGIDMQNFNIGTGFIMRHLDNHTVVM